MTAIDALEYFAGMATKIQGDTIPVPGPYINMTLREPLGVIGGIIPWNYPLLQAVWKIAPAIAAGNCVVLKPAEQACLSVMYLGKLCAEAGIPPGVVNIVPGYGAVAGLALVQHHMVAKVMFTGSTETGKRIAAGGRRNPQADRPGARRQERGGRVRGRADRSGSPDRRHVDLQQPGPGLHGRLAPVPAREDARQGAGEGHRGGQARASSATRWIRPPPWGR